MPSDDPRAPSRIFVPLFLYRSAIIISFMFETRKCLPHTVVSLHSDTKNSSPQGAVVFGTGVENGLARKRSAAPWRRYERVYKRTAGTSMIVFGKESQRSKAKRRLYVQQKSRRKPNEACDDVVRAEITDSAANDPIPNDLQFLDHCIKFDFCYDRYLRYAFAEGQRIPDIRKVSLQMAFFLFSIPYAHISYS